MGEEDGSLHGLTHSWRSALVVNSLHAALEEAERQRDEMARIISTKQQGSPLFADAEIDPRAPESGHLVGDHRTHSAPEGNSFAGQEGRRRHLGRIDPAPPPLLRHSLLETPPATSATSSMWQEPTRASTIGAVCSDASERPTKGSTRERGKSFQKAGVACKRQQRGRSSVPLQTVPRAKAGGQSCSKGSGCASGRSPSSGTGDVKGAGIRGVRSGGSGTARAPRGRDQSPLRLSSGSGASTVAGELRGGELTRVQGRVADLGLAIETSQAKLLEELSQVQEDFFSSFGYTIPPEQPLTGGSGRFIGGGSGAFGGSSGRLSSILAAPSEHSIAANECSPRRYATTFNRSNLRQREPPSPRSRSTDGFIGIRADRDSPTRNPGSSSVGARTTPTAIVTTGEFAFPPSSKRSVVLSPTEMGRSGGVRGRGEERIGGQKSRSRSASPVLPRTSVSPPPRAGWSPAASPRRCPVEKAGMDELRERLLTELVAKEALERDLENTRQQAEEYLQGHEDTAEQLDLLREACRSAEEKSAVLERSLLEEREERERKQAALKEQAEAEQIAARARDRDLAALKEFRRTATERAVSLWLRGRRKVGLQGATRRWREVARKGTWARRTAEHLVDWRARRAIRCWRLQARISTNLRRGFMARTDVLRRPAAMLTARRRRALVCLRDWANLTRRQRTLRKLVQRRAVADLRQSWSAWRWAATAISAEMQRSRLEETTTLLEAAAERVDSLEYQLDQTQVSTAKMSDRIVAVRCRSLRMAALRRNARVVLRAWAEHNRCRQRAITILFRVSARWRRKRLAHGIRSLSTETRSAAVRDRTLIRWKAVKDARRKALWFSLLMEGVRRSREQRQALSRVLVIRPLRVAFERLKRRRSRRWAMRSAVQRLKKIAERGKTSARRQAFDRWSYHTAAASTAATSLCRALTHLHARALASALARWRLAILAHRAQASTERIEALYREGEEGKQKAMRAGALGLIGALARHRRRSLSWGFGKLTGVSTAVEAKSQALRRMFVIMRRRNRTTMADAMSRWRQHVSSRALALVAARRLVRTTRRGVLSRIVRRWNKVVRGEQALECLAGRVERAVTRNSLLQGFRHWRFECIRDAELVTSRRAERCRLALGERLAKAGRRELMLRCLMEWKAHAVRQRCQLQLARIFLRGRNRRTLRNVLTAWRDGRRHRAQVIYAWARVARSFRSAVLREGLRRLAASARHRERDEAAKIVASARLEADQALRDRDAMRARLENAAEQAKVDARERAIAEEAFDERLRREGQRVLGRQCLAGWRRTVQLERRKKACARLLLRRIRRGFLCEAFCSWRDGARGAAALALAERLVYRQRRRELLQRTLRAWAEFSARRRRAAAVISRAERRFAIWEHSRVGRAFLKWETLTLKSSKKRGDIVSAFARLRAVHRRAGRLQVASAFNTWARLSFAASHNDHTAETAISTKRHKFLRIALFALSRHASSRRRARFILASLDKSTMLRRLARGWTAIAAGSAAAGAALGSEVRLGTAEARVQAASTAARARAHRTARRLLGVARGRMALEAFVAWRGLVREGRGSRLGAAALAARSKRRILRQVLSTWRAQTADNSTLRVRTLERLSSMGRSHLRDAFSRWKGTTNASTAAEKALFTLSRVTNRRRSDRAEMRLALSSWRRCVESGSSGGGVMGRTEGGLEGENEVLELLAIVSQEAASAFASAASVPQVFEAVEAFVPQAIPAAQGHILLFIEEPGRGLYTVGISASDGQPVELSFPVGGGLVSLCATTGLPCQARDPPASSSSSASPTRRHSNREYPTVFLSGAADFHSIIAGYDGNYDGVARNAANPPLSSIRHHQHSAPISTATMHLNGSSRHHRFASPGMPVNSTTTNGTVGTNFGVSDGRQRRAFFSTGENEDSGSRSPSPSRASITRSLRRRIVGAGSAGAVLERGQGGQWETLGGGVGMLHVACVPVCGGGRGSGAGLDSGSIGGGGGGGENVMRGVLKAWRLSSAEVQEREKDTGAGRGWGSPRGFTSGEMTLFKMLAGQAAVALTRLDTERLSKEEGKDEREEAVKEEVKRLREAMEHLSGSAQGLARQRDDARRALAKAKSTLRRMAPALREVRDRQLGFRHYHDLIVQMSKSVLNDEDNNSDGDGAFEHKVENLLGLTNRGMGYTATGSPKRSNGAPRWGRPLFSSADSGGTWRTSSSRKNDRTNDLVVNNNNIHDVGEKPSMEAVRKQAAAAAAKLLRESADNKLFRSSKSPVRGGRTGENMIGGKKRFGGAIASVLDSPERQDQGRRQHEHNTTYVEVLRRHSRDDVAEDQKTGRLSRSMRSPVRASRSTRGSRHHARSESNKSRNRDEDDSHRRGDGGDGPLRRLENDQMTSSLRPPRRTTSLSPSQSSSNGALYSARRKMRARVFSEEVGKGREGRAEGMSPERGVAGVGKQSELEWGVRGRRERDEVAGGSPKILRALRQAMGGGGLERG